MIRDNAMATMGAEPRRHPPLLVVTDLDGTLLDHQGYDCRAAREALAALRRRQIPLVLCSSKTEEEMAVLAAELDLPWPLIVENGGAICRLPGPGTLPLARPRGEILAVLVELRRGGFRFRGFHDMTPDEVVALTGLSLEQAARAQVRHFSEPLVWQDEGERLAPFLAALASRGLEARQGGRFLTVSGGSDKGRAVRRLRQLPGFDSEGLLIALGDSFNDEPMLAAADIAVIVHSAHADKLQVSGPGRVIRTAEPGPAGWNRAILALLEEFDHG